MQSHWNAKKFLFVLLCFDFAVVVVKFNELALECILGRRNVKHHADGFHKRLEEPALSHVRTFHHDRTQGSVWSARQYSPDPRASRAAQSRGLRVWDLDAGKGRPRITGETCQSTKRARKSVILSVGGVGGGTQGGAPYHRSPCMKLQM